MSTDYDDGRDGHTSSFDVDVEGIYIYIYIPMHLFEHVTVHITDVCIYIHIKHICVAIYNYVWFL